jgi:multicomponent Na+:H+ antiporter subunit B
MSERLRLRIFFVAVLVFFGLYAGAALNLPAWGHYRGPYGDAIARLAVYERHATDVINAINYDYRGFDTLGEEFILFTASVGVMMLLRREEGGPVSSQKPETVADRPRLSRAIRAVNIPAVILTTLFGFYIGLHGQLTPGGGFQAGVILASALLLLYLAENIQLFNRITSHTAVEVIEAVGAGAYALIGLAPVGFALPLLTNIVPLGKTGDVFSSGNIALISACVGVEVTAAFLVVLAAYFQEIIAGQRPEE